MPAPSTPPIPRVVLTIEEAAALLGWERSTAYKHIRSGALPARRIGGRLRVTIADFEREFGPIPPATLAALLGTATTDGGDGA